MPTPSVDPPIRSLRDARVCLDAGLAALEAIIDYVERLGHRAFASYLRRVAANAGWAVSHILDQIRDEHPELGDLASDDADETDLP